MPAAGELRCVDAAIESVLEDIDSAFSLKEEHRTRSLHGFVPVTPEAEAPRCAKAASRCFSLRCDRHKVLTWEWMGASCYLRLGAALKRPVYPIEREDVYFLARRVILSPINSATAGTRRIARHSDSTTRDTQIVLHSFRLQNTPDVASVLCQMRQLWAAVVRCGSELFALAGSALSCPERATRGSGDCSVKQLHGASNSSCMCFEDRMSEQEFNDLKVMKLINPSDDEEILSAVGFSGYQSQLRVSVCISTPLAPLSAAFVHSRLQWQPSDEAMKQIQAAYRICSHPSFLKLDRLGLFHLLEHAELLDSSRSQNETWLELEPRRNEPEECSRSRRTGRRSRAASRNAANILSVHQAAFKGIEKDRPDDRTDDRTDKTDRQTGRQDRQTLTRLSLFWQLNVSSRSLLSLFFLPVAFHHQDHYRQVRPAYCHQSVSLWWTLKSQFLADEEGAGESEERSCSR
ncbi:unnamed protein product [Pleuronectes platessa]|uniref:Uncharacterized protein n=1 Tax=Pleuronectes platessa TaxID=8262 RepID=A0A9N7YQ54_PLEPL|nr:unnamed protein product [Pleuronectes platessa]